MKQSKLNSGAEHRGGGSERTAAGTARRLRWRSSIAANTASSAAQGDAVRAGEEGQSVASASSQSANLAETIKALVLLAHEQGCVSYDDINDLLPDGVSPDDLNEL
ncbi:MAG: RNA polymerase sigma factor region1.1 domain-containing protein, partial [Verrucomicrobiota bacterium]